MKQVFFFHNELTLGWHFEFVFKVRVSLGQPTRPRL